MDPEFAFQFHKRMELERTRQLEYERVARERMRMMGGAPLEAAPLRGWSVSIRRWWRALGTIRVTTAPTNACCVTPVVCS